MSASEAVALTGMFDRFEAIDLDALVDAADLQQRYDTKYVVPLRGLERFLGSLGYQMKVLEIASRRASLYRTTYFDTPDLATYRAHHQRRRRRYKIRTRTYGPTLTTLEVKTKDKAGRTIKHRCEHPGPRPHELSSEALAYVADRLYEAYAFALPAQLVVSAVTAYTRTTLVDLDAGERITLDTDFRVEHRGRTIAFDPDYVLVETKTPTRVGRADRILRGAGIRPAKVSKYGVGIAALHPQVPSNVWRPALRKLDPAA